MLRSAPRRPASARPLVKVVIQLEPDEDAWHSYGAESMWAEDLGQGRYRLRNIPFAAYGFSNEDVVRAESAEDRLKVTGVAIRGGHSTYRAILGSGIDPKNSKFEQYWEPLQRLGCSYESSEDRILAIDVPPKADIYEVYHLLERGEKEGVWDFEEAHCGHPLSR